MAPIGRAPVQTRFGESERDRPGRGRDRADRGVVDDGGEVVGERCRGDIGLPEVFTVTVYATVSPGSAVATTPSW
jgi:hypothetical protein